jgi:AbiV family abortive infection protein
MTAKNLDQYTGLLNAADLAKGMNAARRNATRLLDDAKFLLESDRFASALALAILSIEESGKVSILRGLAIAPTQEIAWQSWRDYRSHRRKNTQWILPELVKRGARTLEALRLATEPAVHTELLDSVKQIAFYTDCLGNKNWSEPSFVIDGGLAREIVALASTLVKGSDVSETEIRLWIEHLKPAYGQPLPIMKAALKAWRVAMVEHGLAQPDETFVRFVDGGMQLVP